jgi:superfamily II DNA or RNA helicase
MQLRPYQEAAIAAIRAAYKAGKRAPLLCAPTGAGKSAMVKYMLGQTRKRVLYLCHRAELAEMIHADLAAAGLPHGMITARSKTTDDGMNLHVGMVQTVARRLDKLPVFDWVISDEAHLAMSDTWRGILHHYSAAWHLGMSATPCRLDGRGLGDVYDEIVYGPSVRELTDGGYLTRYRAFAPAVALDGIKRSGGDFQMGDAARVLDTSTITGDAIREYGRRMPGKRAIVFCCTREHADHVAGQFRMGGIEAVNVDGSMSASERAARICDFRDGRIPVLTNVDLLTTGFDLPAIEGAIFLRPTQSLALYLQMVGRVLRVAPGKDCALLLDHVGNVLRHGLPDADREWTLDGKPARAAALAVRQCSECFAAFPPAPVCPECGFQFPVAEGRKPKKEVEGELAEVQQTDAERYQEWLATGPLREVMRGRRTVDQIEEVRRARGYHHRWTMHQMQFRGPRAA